VLCPGLSGSPKKPNALVAHRSYLNQLRSSGLTPSTLSNWAFSKVNHFSDYPDFYDDYALTDGVVAETNTGAVVSLAAPYPQADPLVAPSCMFVSGQPIGERAFSGIAAAQQVLRSSIGWALTCGPGFGIDSAD
jgi:hypothetical protein